MPTSLLARKIQDATHKLSTFGLQSILWLEERSVFADNQF